MSYCLNPLCPKPQNPAMNKFCQSCGSNLLLKERYRAIKPIRAGGFAKTFLAVDEHLPSQPRCVIKKFAYEGTETTRAKELFEQEAVRLEQLNHPQIPKLLAHFTQGNEQYLIQEFIAGQNLAEELESKGQFLDKDIRQLFDELLPVIHFIHNQKVIHRDIKPENIIRPLNGGKLVIVDFGVARFINSMTQISTGTMVGTPGYAAPEQLIGKAKFASDIYSLGATSIHLLTNIQPLQLYSDSENDWVWRHYLLNNTVSETLGKIIDNMLAMDIRQRYQSTADIITDMNSLKYTIELLNEDNQRLIAKQIFDKKTDSIPVNSISDAIYNFLQNLTSSHLKKSDVKDWDIISLWREYLLEIVKQDKFAREYAEDKELLIIELNSLKNDHKIRENLRYIVKRMLVLFYNSLDGTEQDKLWEQVIGDLQNNTFNVTKEDLKKAGIKSILSGTVGLLGIPIPIVSRILLQRMTQGLLGWFFTIILGQQATQRFILSLFGGPVGWTIAIGATIWASASAVNKYQNEVKKAKFIEAILFVYVLDAVA